MTGGKCPTCGSALEEGFVATSNGSGLFWSHSGESARLRPHDLEVIVPTGFMGFYSANLPGTICRNCGVVSLQYKPAKKPA